MGACCAPGKFGATTTSAMANGSSYGETKGGLPGLGFCKVLGDGGGGDQVVVAEQSVTVEKNREAAVDVEELLRVLEVAVENEYEEWRGRCNAGGKGDASYYQYQENAASSNSSSAESPTSVYSAAGSVFSRSSFNKEKQSLQQSSSGALESWRSEKEKVSSTERCEVSKGRTRTSFDWAERVDSTLESMHHMQREDRCSELNSHDARPKVADKTYGNFEKILQQIRTMDSQNKSIQPSTSPRPTEVLTELGDYPRGSSDTNSEEAERDRKTVCSTSVTNMTCPTHQVRATSFISLGEVQCQLREQQALPTNHMREGPSMRVDEAYSATDQARKDSLKAVGTFSKTCKTGQAGEVSIAAGDSYANWLERHSKELGWKNDNRYRTVENLRECETYPKDNWAFTDDELKVGIVQEHVAGQSSCTRSWASQGEQAKLELCTTDNVRARNVHLKEGQTGTNGHVDSGAEFGSNCTTSCRSRGTSENVLEFVSFHPGEYVQATSKFPQDVNFVENTFAPSRPMRVPSPSFVVPENNSGHGQEWIRANLSELGRSYEALHNVTTVAPHPSVSPEYFSDYGVAKTLRSPLVTLETPSSGSSGGSRCSKFNSRNGTPKSVLSGGGILATNANHRDKVKVCVRMRPFNDHEKVCPLRQLLCIMGKKVIVKEYDRPTLRPSIDNSEKDAMEFRVDYVVDDSYLQKHRVEKKEESQRRMYESIGLPCLDYALDGYNTTILAYGQVGTGKTHTMIGDGTKEGSGLMPRLAKELMHHLNTDFKGEFEVQVSYLEIYQERIRDLLAVQSLELQASRCGSVKSCATGWFDGSDESTCDDTVDCDTASNASFCVGTPRSWRPNRIPSVYFDSPVQKKEYLKVREHPVIGPYVEGLLWKDVSTWQDLETVMLQGAANRTMAATPMNKCSSRGHTLFTIKLIRGRRRFVHGCPTSPFSLINLVDLAGTEKPQCTRKTSLERQDEYRYINRSLAQLNDVILNLSRNKKFVSYRGSALTWLLRDSLGGNSKLFLIANISPAEQDFQESVNTLRYAIKANRIHSIMTSHPDQKKQLLVSMRKEIQVLHNLVHDLKKKKLAECVSEEFRLARLPILSTFTVPRLEI